jgi:hypothetical protein
MSKHDRPFAQRPPTHTPPPHELPHAPQLAGSLVTLVHSPLQLTKPVGHDWRQTPLWQV